MMRSCLYIGTVQHRRFRPVGNQFRYRVYFACLDLDELDDVFRGRWFWSTRRAALARFRREDHFGDPQQPLAESVRDLVEARTGSRPRGRIRLLTQLRCFGYLMNPVAFYYCESACGSSIEAVVAEVTNTPWGQTHCYVLGRKTVATAASRTKKEFHVSPFMGMDLEYAWRIGVPAERLAVQIENVAADGAVLMDVSMSLSADDSADRGGNLLAGRAIVVEALPVCSASFQSVSR